MQMLERVSALRRVPKWGSMMLWRNCDLQFPLGKMNLSWKLSLERWNGKFRPNGDPDLDRMGQIIQVRLQTLHNSLSLFDHWSCPFLFFFLPDEIVSANSKPNRAQPQRQSSRLNSMISVRCKCELTIYEKTDSSSTEQISPPPVLYKSSELCTITYDSDESAAIEMDDHFYIKASQLYVQPSRGPIKPWGLAESYSAQITLNAIDVEEKWPPSFLAKDRRAVRSGGNLLRWFVLHPRLFADDFRYFAVRCVFEVRFDHQRAFGVKSRSRLWVESSTITTLRTWSPVG